MSPLRRENVRGNSCSCRRQTIWHSARPISNRLVELAALSDEPGRLTRLYLGPAHRRATDLVAYWMRDAGMSVRIDPLASVVGRYEAQRRRHADAAARLAYRQRAQCRPVRWAARRRHRDRGGESRVQIRQALSRSRSKSSLSATKKACALPRRSAGSRALAGTFDEKALDELDESNDFAARGAHRVRLRSVAPVRGETSARIDPSAMSKCISSKARCWKRRACRSASSPRSTASRAGPSTSRASPAMPARCRCRCATMRSPPRPKCCSRSKSGRAAQPNLVATVGQLEVPRSAPNTIPGRVRFTLDIRSPSDRGAQQSRRGHQGDHRRDRRSAAA